MFEKPLSVLLLGAGNMGGALFDAWVHRNILDPKTSAVVAPRPTDRVLAICEERNIPLNPVTDESGYDICVLAVKPQMFPDILPRLFWPNFSNTIFVSIAAGLTIDTIAKLLPIDHEAARIVRTIPNLPASVGKGVTMMTARDNLFPADEKAIERLFSAAGEILWTQSEDQLDRLVGVSGSGPAFVYLLCEAFEEAARAQGANPEDAARIAKATVLGAAAYLDADGGEPHRLRAAVTSKGGVTAAALEVLDDPDTGLRPMMKAAVQAAYQRGLELGK